MMPTTDLQTPAAPGLLRAICERPEDDFLRLLYADTCEEAGDVQRAEFIRCQLELATLPPDPVLLRDVQMHPRSLTGTPGTREEALTLDATMPVEGLPNPAPAAIGTLASAWTFEGTMEAEGVKYLFPRLLWDGRPVANRGGVVRTSLRVLPVLHDGNVIFFRPVPNEPTRRQVLSRRAQELLEAHRQAWLRDMPCPMDAWSLDEPMNDWAYGVRCRFDRGFVQAIASTTADFLRYAAAIFAVQPVTRIRVLHLPLHMAVRSPSNNNLWWYCDIRYWLSQTVSYDNLYVGTGVSHKERTAFWEAMCFALEKHNFDSQEEAIAAGDLAIVNYGRTLAGLPPLPAD